MSETFPKELADRKQDHRRGWRKRIARQHEKGKLTAREIRKPRSRQLQKYCQAPLH